MTSTVFLNTGTDGSLFGAPALRAWLARRARTGNAALGYVQCYLDDTNACCINDRHPAWPKGRAHEHFRIVGDNWSKIAAEYTPQLAENLAFALTTSLRL